MYISGPTHTVNIMPATGARLLPRASDSTSTDNDYCYGLSCGNEWVWARWILFVFFLLAIAALALTAVKVNGKRLRLGQRPIVGTSWFTPPTYRQSERQYRSTTQDYVPVYTETANANDMGYYDNQGIFHLNSKAENMDPPPPLDSREISVNPQAPAAAITRDNESVRSHSIDFSRDFHQYYRGTAAGQSDTGFDGNSSTTPPQGVPDPNFTFSEMQQVPERPQKASQHRT
ncbi:LANO_0C03708g1_1 [Lachancea nothofagi CBS 11611]|uniref:LANO_0C03708g1_1 n=1 Tax=Lachancea nothofagi CBS 11611 TaxID=1266666 RepID=A0A1G4J5W9_9SACH|nr:LANO_0C03708g1_1 [Lachancea nothofagi CBS 11611]